MSLRRQARPHLPVRAIAYGCSGALLFTLQDAAVKWFSDDYPIWQIIFLRCFPALFLSVLWVWRFGGASALRVQHPKLFICSLIANVTAWYAFYTGLAMLPLTIAICVFFLTPVVISVGAVPMLREPLTWRQVTALLCGFAGVLVIVNPWAPAANTTDGDANAPINLVAVGLILVSVVMWAGMALITRALESSITVGATLLYNNFFFLVISALFQPVVWTPPSDDALLGMLLLGVLGLAAQACVFTAYRSARAAVTATAEYTALIWAVLLGWLIWDELFTLRSALGAALIIAAGMIVMHSSRGGNKNTAAENPQGG